MRPPDCDVPFTLRNIEGDLEDIGSRFDGAPDLEFRAATKALELEKSALSHQRLPPGYRFPYGHTHKKQEEVYVVLRGSGRMKVDDEIVELKEWDAVRVPPGTWRGYEAGPEGPGVRVRVPSCAWVMLLTIARPRPTPAWSVRIRLVPRRNGSTSVATTCGVSFSPVFSTVSTALFG